MAYIDPTIGPQGGRNAEQNRRAADAVAKYAFAYADSSADEPTARTEGRHVVRRDEDKVYVDTGSALLQVLDYGAHDSWTPQVAQNGNRTSTNAFSHWWKSGRLVIATFDVNNIQAGSAGNAITITNLPFASAAQGSIAAAALHGIGSFVYFDSGTAYYSGVAAVAQGGNSTTLFFQCHNVAATLGAAPSFATATTDSLAGTVIYEATS